MHMHNIDARFFLITVITIIKRVIKTSREIHFVKISGLGHLGGRPAGVGASLGLRCVMQARQTTNREPDRGQPWRTPERKRQKRVS